LKTDIFCSNEIPCCSKFLSNILRFLSLLIQVNAPVVMDANSLTSSMKTPPLLLVVKVVTVLVDLVSATLSNVVNVIVDLDAASLTKPVPVDPTVVTVDEMVVETVVAQVSEIKNPSHSFKFLTFSSSFFSGWTWRCPLLRFPTW
jgi:hypothetical protein